MRARSALGIAASVLLGVAATGATPALALPINATTSGGKVTAPHAAAAPSSVTTVPDVTVAMIDTGVRATHQEFNYGGASDTTDQFVAWWDFSDDAANHLPTLGQTWDTTFADPFDPNGHGTATASLSVGANAAPAATKMPSFAPGAKLAIAKVGDAAGGVSGNIAEAFKWARETVHPDVISMSIGNIVPLPALVTADVYREIRLAREAGILVVLSNGNGFANAGGPGEPGFATGFANSPYALGVGANDLDGLLVTTDPEVTAAFFDVPSASNSCNTCYAPITGTSFSAPLVAGFAAHLKQLALANGAPSSPAQIETLVKYSARDTTLPPTFEGYGVIDALQLSAAETHAANGTLPTRPSPDINGLFVETMQGTLDSVWTEHTSSGLETITRAMLGGVTPLGSIGPSAPTGLGEAEVYTLSATAGQTVTVDMAYIPPDAVNDVDLYVFRNDGGTSYNGNQLVTKSNGAAGVNEHVQFVAPVAGTYSVVVLGWSVATPQAYSLTASTALEYWYQDYVLHTFGTGLFL